MRRAPTVLVALLLPALAQAEAPRARGTVAILPLVIAGPHGDATVSALYAAAIRATEPRLGLRAISAEEMFVASREGLADRVRDCGADAACIASKLRMFDARLGLVAVANFALDPPVFDLRLLDTDRRAEIASRVGELPPGADLAATLTAATDGLLDAAGFVKSGRVVVDADPPRALLRLADGTAPDPGTPNVFTLPPGRYAVEGRLEGFELARGEITVSSGETTRLALRLEEDTSVWASPWLWGGVGVVVAGAAVSAALLARPDPRPCLCLSEGNGCFCD